MVEPWSPLARRTFGSSLLVALSGCSALEAVSNERSIEVESRDITWRRTESTSANHSAQVLYSDAESELLVSGAFPSEEAITDLYPRVLTTTAADHNKIQVRIEAESDSTRGSESVYEYLAALRFRWVPDIVEILVQHQQTNGDMTIVVHRTISASSTPSERDSTSTGT